MPNSDPRLVRTPRSKGCRTCVERRVKCDLTKPFCQRCAKANRVCPGFAPDIQFIDESARIPARSDRGRSSDLELVRKDYAERRRTSPVVLEVDVFNQLVLCDGIRSPSAFHAQLVSQYSQSVSDSFPADESLTYRYYGFWLKQVLDMNSVAPALELAMRAMAMHYLGQKAASDALDYHSRRYYGQALLHLNRALRDTEQSRAMETLCATVLLSFYEIANTTAQESWVRHAAGTSRLMQLRGPAKHRCAFGRNTLFVCRYFLITESMINQESCFLNEPEWRQLLRELHLTSPRRSPIHDAAEDFFVEVGGLPEYFKAVHHMTQESDRVHNQLSAAALARLRAILVDGRQIHDRLVAVHARMNSVLSDSGFAPLQLRSPTDDPVIPLIYDFPTPYIRSLYCGYWALLALLNLSLAKLQHIEAWAVAYSMPDAIPPLSFNYDIPHSPTSLAHFTWDTTRTDPLTPASSHLYRDEAVACARRTCMSAVPAATKAMLGTTFLVFALRACLRALPTEVERKWVETRLCAFSGRVGIAKFGKCQITL